MEPRARTTVVSLRVNGESYEEAVEPRMLLVDFLRERLRLTGTHIGCEYGKCGACTVHVDGRAVKSCMMLACQVEGAEVTTVEGLAMGDTLRPLQRAFQRHHALQCGYCTPGFLMAAEALLASNPNPTEAEVRTALAGNLCRCTGYENIVKAVLATASGEDEPEETGAARSTGATSPSGAPTWVGTSVPRFRDPRLLTGGGRYTADFVVERMLYAAILRSPVAHARIRHIDVSKARSLPGVVGVVTGAEAAKRWRPLPPTIDISVKLNESYAIAVDRVRYEGEPVAALAATDPYLAEDALSAIDVDYEELPVLANPEAALAEGAPLLYEEWGDNIALEWSFRSGDVEAALESAAHHVRVRIPHHRYTGTPMEARACLASYDPFEKDLTVHLSTQSPNLARTLLAQTLGLPEARIRVLAHDIGGGFGTKLQIDAEVIPCLLSIQTGRPVRWVETRSENLASGIHSRDYEWELEAGFESAGRFAAIRADLVADIGCDGTNRAAGTGALLVGGFYLPGSYRVPRYEVKVRGVVTNKAPYGAYRGYGKDIACHGIERLMDLAAAQIGKSPLELRRINFIQPEEFPYTQITGPIYDSGDYPRLLSMVEAKLDVPAFRERQAEARKEGRYLGVGFCAMLEPSGGAVPNCIFNGYETATIRIMPEGDVLLLTGQQDIGQGVDTTLAQVVADEFRIHPNQVKVVSGDSQGIPYGLGAWSSRGASFGVSAAANAARKVVEKLLKIASRILEVAENDLELVEGGVQLRGAPMKRLTLTEIGRAVHLKPGPYLTVPEDVEPNLEATVTWTNPVARWVPDEVGTLSIYATHPSACNGAIVEVNADTGKITIERMVIAHDCGTLIHPQIVEGQIVGGTIQGIGAALSEELRYDADGHLQNRSFLDYLIPTADDVPRIEVEHIVCPSPFTTLGTKGMGEGGPIAAPAVIMNAVDDALRPLGVRVSELPLTRERILRVIHSAREGLGSIGLYHEPSS